MMKMQLTTGAYHVTSTNFLLLKVETVEREADCRDSKRGVVLEEQGRHQLVTALSTIQ